MNFEEKAKGWKAEGGKRKRANKDNAELKMMNDKITWGWYPTPHLLLYYTNINYHFKFINY